MYMDSGMVDFGMVKDPKVDLGVSKVLLIDLENCPSQLHQLPTDLHHYLQVVICYATSHSKVPLNWLISLSAAISANKLKIVKMACVSKNSADFGICFLAGAMMQELPPETHFVIVSNDKDLDHTVHLLKSHGRSAERLGNQKAKEIPDLPQGQSSPIVLYCTYILTYNTNRPTRPAALLNSIKTHLKEYPSIAEPVYHKLLSSGAIKITGRRLIYNDPKLKELANYPIA